MSEQIFSLEGPNEEGFFCYVWMWSTVVVCACPVESHLIAQKAHLSRAKIRVCVCAHTRTLTRYTSPSMSSRFSEAAFCNRIWLKREQSARCETWLFIVILIHQRQDGKGLRKGKKGKPELRGVTRRAIKELFVFVPRTLEEKEGGSFQIH